MYLVEVVLQGISGINACHSRVKSRTEQRGESRFLEFVVIRPLPRIIEVRGKALFPAPLLVNGTPLGIIGIFRLVVGGIDIVRPALEARVHYSKILIGQRHIQHCMGLELLHERTEGIETVRVNGRCR